LYFFSLVRYVNYVSIFFKFCCRPWKDQLYYQLVRFYAATQQKMSSVHIRSTYSKSDAKPYQSEGGNLCHVTMEIRKFSQKAECKLSWRPVTTTWFHVVIMAEMSHLSIFLKVTTWEEWKMTFTNDCEKYFVVTTKISKRPHRSKVHMCHEMYGGPFRKHQAATNI